MKKSVVVGAVAVVAAGIGVVGTVGAAEPTSASASTGTVTFELKVTNDQVRFVDHAPAGVTLGDMYIFSDKLSRDGKPVGNDGGSCVVTHYDPATDIDAEDCTISIKLPEGQITAKGLWVRGTDLTMAITGGTDAYKTARGQLLATNIDTPNEAYRVTVIR